MLECWPQWNSPSDDRKAEFHGVKIKELRIGQEKRWQEIFNVSEVTFNIIESVRTGQQKIIRTPVKYALL